MTTTQPAFYHLPAWETLWPRPPDLYCCCLGRGFAQDLQSWGGMYAWAPRCSAVGFCGHPILQMRKLRLKEVRELNKMHSQACWMPGSKA